MTNGIQQLPNNLTMIIHYGYASKGGWNGKGCISHGDDNLTCLVILIIILPALVMMMKISPVLVMVMIIIPVLVMVMIILPVLVMVMIILPV